MIVNKKKKAILAKKYKICKSFLSKTIGLIFSLKPKTLLFIWQKEKIRNIHMILVFFPIDVLWLDRNKKVIDMRKRFMPFLITNTSKPAKYIIELPEGTIKKTKTEKEDLIKF